MSPKYSSLIRFRLHRTDFVDESIIASCLKPIILIALNGTQLLATRRYHLDPLFLWLNSTQGAWFLTQRVSERRKYF